MTKPRKYCPVEGCLAPARRTMVGKDMQACKNGHIHPKSEWLDQPSEETLKHHREFQQKMRRGLTDTACATCDRLILQLDNELQFAMKHEFDKDVIYWLELLRGRVYNARMLTVSMRQEWDGEK